MVQTVSMPLSLRDIRVTDSFWKREMELVRTRVIPYQWEALNDRVPGAAPSFCMRNYRLAGALTKARREGREDGRKRYPVDVLETLPKDMEHMEDRFYGFLFQDSDFAKWVEAVAYSLTQHPDEALERLADGAIEIVCAAQQENGYLDTFYIINDMSKIFTNLRDNHELYCFGHLTEGAVAYYQATGKDMLLNAAKRYADFIISLFGEEEGKKKGYPGHEIAEMALVRLYEVTGKKKYLDLCRFFLEQRGVRPYYFDREHPKAVEPGREEELRYQYHQAHLPVRLQEEAVGHAVRAVYLYSGMADLARIAGDEELFAAVRRLWEDITERKMYITGGIGATHLGEAFSFAYDLPNDTAYAETCASIGLIFFARRMLQMEADSRYADVMERALYNGVLSGMALDGESFFYVNPLKVLPRACREDARKFHVKPVRQKWFGCACCPPNIARLLSSLASYAYGVGADTLFVHLYLGGEIDFHVGEKQIHYTVTSQMPWSGAVVLETETAEPTEAVLALRIPDWCGGYTINGKANQKGAARVDTGSFAVLSAEMKDGYLYLRKTWRSGDRLELDFSMPVRLMQANGQVEEDAGCVAVTRGPLVYCMEEADNGRGLTGLSLDANDDASLKETVICRVGENGHAVTQITVNGRRRIEPAGADGLYRVFATPAYEAAVLTFVPYYTWANRGEGEMQVWTPYYLADGKVTGAGKH